MFSAAHSVASPTIMHTLLVHKYGSQDGRRIFIIPHRLKNSDESKTIFTRVEKNFWQTVKERNLEESPNVLTTSLMLTELLELLIQVFHESEYVYNQDVFLGIDFQQESNQGPDYTFDEIADDLDSTAAVHYYLRIAHTYNPLLMLNPFGLQAESSYHALAQETGETTLIGQTITDSDLVAIKNISDNIHGHCVVLDSLKDLLIIKELKLKTIIDSSKLKNKIALEELKKSQADFIIS